jgi:hypothetical protein
MLLWIILRRKKGVLGAAATAATGELTERDGKLKEGTGRRMGEIFKQATQDRAILASVSLRLRPCSKQNPWKSQVLG